MNIFALDENPQIAARMHCDKHVRAGDTRDNFMWLYWHGRGLTLEFEHRFGKTHACDEQLVVCGSLWRLVPEGKLTPFAQAMPDEYKNSCSITAYRDYYFYDKRENIQCEWTKGRQAPDWWYNRLDSVCLTT